MIDGDINVDIAVSQDAINDSDDADRDTIEVDSDVEMSICQCRSILATKLTWIENK